MIDSIANFTEGHSFYYDHVHLRPEEQIGLHSQSTWELSYIITGNGVCRFGKSVSNFSSGEVVLVPPELPHCWTFDGKTVDKEGKIENITLAFNPDFLYRMASAFYETQSLIEQLATLDGALRFTKAAAAPLMHIMDNMKSQSDAERLSGLVSLIILLAENMNQTETIGKIDKTSDTEKRLKEIETYINCNFKRDIAIEDIARHVGMNRSSFCTFFRKAKGMTFVTYLNTFRLEIACGLLRQGKDSIAEVCYRSGFRDIPYFNRVFKRMKGMTPSEYRKAEAFVSTTVA